MFSCQWDDICVRLSCQLVTFEFSLLVIQLTIDFRLLVSRAVLVSRRTFEFSFLVIRGTFDFSVLVSRCFVLRFLVNPGALGFGFLVVGSHWSSVFLSVRSHSSSRFLSVGAHFFSVLYYI